jgi:cell division protein FtsB
MVRSIRINLNLLIYILIIISAIWVSYIIIYGRGGVVKRRELDRQVLLLQAEIQELQNEKKIVERAIVNMKDNPRYIEGFARELGYRREGEIIFKFIEKSEQFKKAEGPVKGRQRQSGPRQEK